MFSHYFKLLSLVTIFNYNFKSLSLTIILSHLV